MSIQREQIERDLLNVIYLVRSRGGAGWAPPLPQRPILWATSPAKGAGRPEVATHGLPAGRGPTGVQVGDGGPLSGCSPTGAQAGPRTAPPPTS